MGSYGFFSEMRFEELQKMHSNVKLCRDKSGKLVQVTHFNDQPSLPKNIYVRDAQCVGQITELVGDIPAGTLFGAVVDYATKECGKPVRHLRKLYEDTLNDFSNLPNDQVKSIISKMIAAQERAKAMQQQAYAF